MDRELVDRIKDAADIVQIVGARVSLKKSGSRFVGLCPFHNERSPSFSVNPDMRLWYCFGCHANGDVVSFIQQIYGVSFIEAMQQLSEQTGIPIPEDGSDGGSGAREKAAAARALLRMFIERSATTLQESEEAQAARDWLKSRKCKRSTALEWGLGYATQSTINAVRREDSNLAYEIGLTASYWLGRVIFPIYDPSGEPVAISGRKLSDDAPGGKYVNSPSNFLYDKSRVLYGMQEAAKHIKQMGYAVLVEGQADCLAMHEMGYGNTLASCGTAIGVQHLRWVQRFAPKLVLALDADAAGVRGVDKAVAASRGMPLDIVWAVLPDGADPSDLLVAGRQEVIHEAIRAARQPIQVHLDGLTKRISETSDIPERVRLINAGIERIDGLDDPIQRHEYMERWTTRFNTPMPHMRVDNGMPAGPGSLPELDSRALQVLFQDPSADVRPWMVHSAIADIVIKCREGNTPQQMVSEGYDGLDENQKIIVAQILQEEDAGDDPAQIIDLLTIRKAQGIISEAEDLLSIGALGRLVSLARAGDARACADLKDTIENLQWNPSKIA